MFLQRRQSVDITGIKLLGVLYERAWPHALSSYVQDAANYRIWGIDNSFATVLYLHSKNYGEMVELV